MVPSIPYSCLASSYANGGHSSNLLYPKEDRVTNQLMFTCRTCHVGEPASSYCVYQNKLNTQVGDTAGVTQDVGSDPTVGIPGFCTLCGDEITCFACGLLPDEALSEEEESECLELIDGSHQPSAGDSIQS